MRICGPACHPAAVARRLFLRVHETAPARLLGSWSQWAAIALCAILGVCLFVFVDLTPEVEADFFFTTDSRQIQKAAAEDRFSHRQQVLIAARAPRLVSQTYLRRIHELTEDLRRVPGVADVRSIHPRPGGAGENVGARP